MEITDEMCDAASEAWHEYAFGLEEPLTKRELGIMRQGMRVALEAGLSVETKQEDELRKQGALLILGRLRNRVYNGADDPYQAFYNDGLAPILEQEILEVLMRGIGHEPEIRTNPHS